MNLSDYEVTFKRNPLLGFWSWSAKSPGGEALVGWQASFTKQAAERDAFLRIQRHAEQETISGDELAKRIASHPEGVGPSK